MYLTLVSRSFQIPGTWMKCSRRFRIFFGVTAHVSSGSIRRLSKWKGLLVSSSVMQRPRSRAAARPRRDDVPHAGAACVGEVFRMARHLRVRAHLQAVEYDARRLGHRFTGDCNGRLDVTDRCRNQQGVMYGCTDLNTAFGGKTTGEAQHL